MTSKARSLKPLAGGGAQARRGFTAVEIAMVATVIAIIALLILPIYRQRVEAARKAAVIDELSSIAKAQLLVEADVNMQARLQDLDNTQVVNFDGGNAQEIIPFAAWNGTLEAVVPKSRQTLIGVDVTGEPNWKGPYLAMKKTATVQELQDYWYNGPTLGAGGFIYVVGQGTPAYPGPPPIVDNPTADRYPLDPWGNPYIFFGVGRFPNDAPLSESFFNSSVAYSLGPDGLPGDEITPFGNPGAYRPRAPLGDGVLGLGDDEEYRF